MEMLSEATGPLSNKHRVEMLTTLVMMCWVAAGK
jgi:hypothetical protein